MIDHPYSTFLNVSPELMKELAPVGILVNLTWDELSPLLGVDPRLASKKSRIGPNFQLFYKPLERTFWGL